MSLVRAQAWREQFNVMGWWRPPDMRFSALYGLLEEQGAPHDPQSRYEPWLFCCPVSYSDWLIGRFQVLNHPELAAIRGQYEDLWVVGTRTRLMAAETRARWVLDRPYSRILRVDWLDAVFSIELDNQQVIQLTVKAAGPKWYDLGIVLTAPFTKGGYDGSYLAASQAIDSANATRADFLGVLRQFWREVLGD